MEIKLLPRKEFELILDSGTVIPGKFGNWTIQRFRTKRGLKLSELQNVLNDPEISSDAIADFLLCAVEYKLRLDRKPFDYLDVDAYDWIEQMDGYNGEKFLALFNHGADEDKKKLESHLNGNSTNSFAMQQESVPNNSGQVILENVSGS